MLDQLESEKHLTYAISRDKSAEDRLALAHSVHSERQTSLGSFLRPKVRRVKESTCCRDREAGREATETCADNEREFHEKKRSNNTSGVPDVHFLRSKAQPRGSWQAWMHSQTVVKPIGPSRSQSTVDAAPLPSGSLLESGCSS
jgi:hypothetical protein